MSVSIHILKSFDFYDFLAERIELNSFANKKKSDFPKKENHSLAAFL